MKVRILDKKENSQNKNWYLGVVSLWDYLSCITPENFLFDVQRGIVKNQYLDSILESVYSAEAIPPITIISDDITLADDYANINSFEILDGLQRSYRLWLYKHIAEIAVKETSLFEDLEYQSYNISATLNKIKSESYFIPGIISVKQIKNLLSNSNKINITNIEKAFKEFNIYLYIWGNLDDQEVIKKMLILNAGQKMVTVYHQYELMFMHILKNRTLIDGVRLFRVKDTDYGKIRQGERNVGDYVFSTIIIGLQSMIANKPLRVSRENLEQFNDDDYVSQEIMNSYFNQPFLNAFLEQIYEFDKDLKEFDSSYLKWFVKDTTIAGILSAIGKQLNLNNSEQLDIKVFNSKFEEIRSVLKLNGYFHLDEFYKEYNSLSSSRINIGDVVRQAIYSYTLACISGSSISWYNAFNLK